VISHFEEITGQGIVAIIDGMVKVGSRPFVNVKRKRKLQTAVHI
jgi:hypothetical protein